MERGELLTRFERAKEESMLWWWLFDRAYGYALPDRNLFRNTTNQPGQNKNPQVYDTTAVHGVTTLASKLQALLTPPKINWCTLEAGPQVPMQNRAAFNQMLQEVTETMFYYIHNSNFATIINESYYDLAVGTGTIIVNEGDDYNPLDFRSVPLREFYPEPTASQELKTFFQDFEFVYLRDVPRIWPNAKIGPELRYAMDADPSQQMSFIQAMICHPDNPKKKEYEFIVYCKETQEFLIDEFSESSAWICFRWSRLTNETYGRGPVIHALPSILTLNKIMESEIKGAEFKVNPVWMGFADGVFNPWTTNIVPNTIIPIHKQSASNPPLIPFPQAGDPQFAQVLSVDLRNQINALLFDQPLGPLQQPVKSATEISLRQQNFMQEIGPAFGRLEVELITPIIHRVVYILKKKGLFPKIEIDGKNVSLSYNSPLTQSQKLQKAINFGQFMQLLTQTVGPQIAMGGINLPLLPQSLGEAFDVDLSLIKSPEQIMEAVQNQMQQVQQQQAQLPGSAGSRGPQQLNTTPIQQGAFQ